jgi:hypothetical protein
MIYLIYFRLVNNESTIAMANTIAMLNAIRLSKSLTNLFSLLSITLLYKFLLNLNSHHNIH